MSSRLGFFLDDVCSDAFPDASMKRWAKFLRRVPLVHGLVSVSHFSSLMVEEFLSYGIMMASAADETGNSYFGFLHCFGKFWPRSTTRMRMGLNVVRV